MPAQTRSFVQSKILGGCIDCWYNMDGCWSSLLFLLALKSWVSTTANKQAKWEDDHEDQDDVKVSTTVGWRIWWCWWWWWWWWWCHEFISRGHHSTSSPPPASRVEQQLSSCGGSRSVWTRGGSGGISDAAQCRLHCNYKLYLMKS